MSLPKNIFACTRPGSGFPAYVSINATEDGRVSITTRGPQNGDEAGPLAEVVLSQDEFNFMKDALLKWERTVPPDPVPAPAPGDD